jgi:hypothetical protein
MKELIDFTSRGLVADEKAQVSIDLLLGVTILLLSITVLFVQSGVLFFPTSLSATDNAHEADRYGSGITQDEVGTVMEGMTADEVETLLTEIETDGASEVESRFGERKDMRIQVYTLNNDSETRFDKRRAPPILDPSGTHAYDVENTDGRYIATAETSDFTTTTTPMKTKTWLNSRQAAVEVVVQDE